MKFKKLESRERRILEFDTLRIHPFYRHIGHGAHEIESVFSNSSTSENPLSSSQLVPDEQADMLTLPLRRA